MARILRFLMYGGMSFWILVSKGQSLRICLSVLFGKDVYMEDTFFLVSNTIILICMTIYVVWLLGATIDRWKMPLPTHLLPFAALCFLLWENGWIFASESTYPGAHLTPRSIQTPVDRAMDAMASAKVYLERHPCDTAKPEEIVNGLSAGSYSGYRTFGFSSKWNIQIKSSEEPVTELSGNDVPGTIFVACNPKDKSFVLSALITDAFPKGKAAFVLDGVGKPATIAGQLR